MTDVLSVVTAAAFSRRISNHPTGLLAALLIFTGVMALAVGGLGWRYAERIVPTSLPETLYRRRAKVLRRGAASFLLLGVVAVVMGVALGVAT